MMKPRLHSVIVNSLFFCVCVAYLIMATQYPLAYIWATYEDLLGEWAQFYFFLSAVLISCRYACTTKKYRIFFITLAVACFYVVMEEISWGQRLFGWRSSAFFKTHNLQGETNLHNMLTGPYSTFLKAALTYTVALGLAIYGCIFPFTFQRDWKPSVWLEKIGVPVPPMYLAPLFVVAAFLETGFISFNEAEIAELLVGMGLAFFSLHYLHSAQNNLNYLSNEWSHSSSCRFSFRIVNLTFIVLLLAIATTFSIYATDSGKKRADRRIFNGVEKFSGRYERYQDWDKVIVLNKMLLKKHPRNRSYLRDIGQAYQKKENSKQANLYFREAIMVDLNRLKDDPWRASTYRSLVRTYRLLGENDKVETYMIKALKNGQKRLQTYPESTKAMYSLGRTYELNGEYDKARGLISRAYQANPRSKTYRKAFYRLKK